MEPRRTLLKRLASVTDWDRANRTPFEGESWIRTRNTLYRFRDGICTQVACSDPLKKGRARVLLGMRLVGWLDGGAERQRLSYDWTPGASALLWRPGKEGSDESMAMTSRTTAFTRGRSASNLQAIHDQEPPADSQRIDRGGVRTPTAVAVRPPARSEASGAG